MKRPARPAAKSSPLPVVLVDLVAVASGVLVLARQERPTARAPATLAGSPYSRPHLDEALASGHDSLEERRAAIRMDEIGVAMADLARRNTIAAWSGARVLAKDGTSDLPPELVRLAALEHPPAPPPPPGVPEDVRERAKAAKDRMERSVYARTAPERRADGQAILDYGLALKESGARWEEWAPWIQRVEHEPDPIGEQARTILDPKEEAARKAFLDGSDGHRERKPRFDEVR